MPKGGVDHVKHNESFSEPFILGPESSGPQSYGTFSARGIRPPDFLDEETFLMHFSLLKLTFSLGDKEKGRFNFVIW